MTLTWNDNAGTGLLALVTGIAFIAVVWSSMLMPGDERYYSVIAGVFIVMGIFMMRAKTRISILPARVDCKAGSYSFADISKVMIDGKRIVLTLREGTIFELAASRDRRVTQFVADVVNDRVTE